MNAKWYLRFIAIMSFMTMLTACASTPDIPLPLPPQLCKPASDLVAPKHLKRVPEVATENDQFYSLFLMERADHATDIKDFNSLLRTCVDSTLPEHIPVFAD